MKEINDSSFEEFIHCHMDHFPSPKGGVRRSQSHYQILYRGLSRHEYELETSLERYGHSQCTVQKYAKYVSSCCAEYNSYMGTDYLMVPDSEKWQNWVSLSQDQTFLELAVQLRHHGFPSPLLDWTASPYIAAYFAYANADLDRDVAVYAYMEITGHGKSGVCGAPQIHSIGPHLNTHERHHIQQGQYTVCTQLKKDCEVFVPHEEFVSENNNEEQDILVKFVMPGEERDRVLNDLSRMNVNAYTLFRNEEGLCNFLAQKHLRQHES